MLGDRFDNTATLFIGFAGFVGFAWYDITCPVPNCPGIDLIRDEFTLLNNVLIHHRGWTTGLKLIAIKTPILHKCPNVLVYAFVICACILYRRNEYDIWKKPVHNTISHISWKKSTQNVIWGWYWRWFLEIWIWLKHFLLQKIWENNRATQGWCFEWQLKTESASGNAEPTTAT